MADFMDKLFDQSVYGLQKTLDLTWKRNEALTSNVSNAETPQYRAMDVDFASELDKAFNPNQTGALQLTNSKHLNLESQSNSKFVEDFTGATKPDGNNVDLDVQMGKMVFNAGKYSMSASLIRKKLHMMRMAIRFAAR